MSLPRAWLEGRAVVPTITALHGHHDALRAAELDRSDNTSTMRIGQQPDQGGRVEVGHD